MVRASARGSDLPVGVGFGITGTEAGGRAARESRTRVVVGSAVMRLVEDHPGTALVPAAREFLRSARRRRAHGAAVRTHPRGWGRRDRPPPPSCGRAARRAPSWCTGSSSSAGSSSVPRCGHHLRLTAEQRLQLLLDRGSFVERDAGVGSRDVPRVPGRAAVPEAPARHGGANRASGSGRHRDRPRRRHRDRDRGLQLPFPRRQHGLGGRREDHALDRACLCDVGCRS